MSDLRLSSAVACARCAAQAVQAVSLWVQKLNPVDRDAVLKRLYERRDWTAARIWRDEVESWNKNPDAPSGGR